MVPEPPGDEVHTEAPGGSVQAEPPGDDQVRVEPPGGHGRTEQKPAFDPCLAHQELVKPEDITGDPYPGASQTGAPQTEGAPQDGISLDSTPLSFGKLQIFIWV